MKSQEQWWLSPYNKAPEVLAELKDMPKKIKFYDIFKVHQDLLDTSNSLI